MPNIGRQRPDIIAKTCNGTYCVNEMNIERMKNGLAPIGIDDHPVNLHHQQGISVNMYDYVEMTHTQHYSNFRENHPWLY